MSQCCCFHFMIILNPLLHPPCLQSKALLLAQQVAVTMQYQLQATYAPTAALAILIAKLQNWSAVSAAIPSAAAQAMSTVRS